jgi:acyl-homoserine-lactone acylase
MLTPRVIITAVLGCAAFGAFVPAYAATAAAAATSIAHSTMEAAGGKKTAQRVSILRDKWGIPHVFGKTDADAVFDLMYAQAEDDFNRVELNYINAMGRAVLQSGYREAA